MNSSNSTPNVWLLTNQMKKWCLFITSSTQKSRQLRLSSLCKLLLNLSTLNSSTVAIPILYLQCRNSATITAQCMIRQTSSCIAAKNRLLRISKVGFSVWLLHTSEFTKQLQNSRQATRMMFIWKCCPLDGRLEKLSGYSSNSKFYYLPIQLDF